MNNDYKSALSKIHLDDMKKEQMKQLFKKKHMNKKNKIIKSVVAAAAAVAIVVGTVSVGKMLGVAGRFGKFYTAGKCERNETCRSGGCSG